MSPENPLTPIDIIGALDPAIYSLTVRWAPGTRCPARKGQINSTG
jgi:hypothetical protein